MKMSIDVGELAEWLYITKTMLLTSPGAQRLLLGHQVVLYAQVGEGVA